MNEKDQVRLNFRIPSEVDDLLMLYQEQTGIAMSDVVRQVVSGWVDSTVHLRGAMEFGASWRRTGVWLPRRLFDALMAKLEPASLTRGQVLARLLYNFLVGRVVKGQPSQAVSRDDPAVLQESLRRLYSAVKAQMGAPILREVTPVTFDHARQLGENLDEAMRLAADMIGEEFENDGAHITGAAHPARATQVAQR